jgi:hypothetical protein
LTHSSPPFWGASLLRRTIGVSPIVARTVAPDIRDDHPTLRLRELTPDDGNDLDRLLEAG